MNLFFTISISLIFSLLSVLIFKRDKKKRVVFWGAIIIFFGCFIRLYQIDKYPIGLNQDEASIGYEAYSLVNYGIDRHGMTLPVHFISWGSGQNTLYAYLLMPLVKLIHNDNLLVRLPMSIIGCITLLVIYVFIRRHLSEKNQVLVLLMMAIMPWHIIKSRWGLESNIFPDLILYAVILLYEGVDTKKNTLMYISAILFGISTYAYGTSYCYVPVLLILTYGYLIYRKKITAKLAFVLLWITALISLPMIMFVIINYFDFNTVHIFKLTIPRLYYTRFVGITSLGGKHHIWTNFVTMMQLILNQDDMGLHNRVLNYGIFYYISSPFLIYGIVMYFVNYRKYEYLNIVLIMLISAILTGCIVVGNINRLNILWIPLFIFIILGIVDITSNKYIRMIVIVVYLIHFVFFVYDYFGKYQETLAFINNDGLKNAILNASDNVYITDDINQPYIFWLYYKKISPYDYLDKQVIYVKKAMFQRVTSIGNTRFFKPRDYILREGNNYILHRILINNYNTEQCKITNYQEFVYVEC